ncbi:MAG: 2-C-methyl-D-erythritol 2,4-cyclodiphosphate synthase [Succinivibrio sp.]|nr:2-C-methyl-D-erythritol 2,4-cyclodiphosphate synthase [Succinivibrio sp.]
MSIKRRLPFRVGQGFDVHRFGADRPCRLGGVDIADAPGLIAHSDGDVLIHALCDALLGALALGDIGKLFPDTSPEFLNADSRVLLRRVVALVHEQGYVVGNVDVTCICQIPKLSPYRDEIRANLASDLEIELSEVSVKATTTEKLGFTGRKEGIACEACALLTLNA